MLNTKAICNDLEYRPRGGILYYLYCRRYHRVTTLEDCMKCPHNHIETYEKIKAVEACM